MSNELFTVTNHHSANCGISPIFNGDDGNYHSYFENEYGEQWVFVYNRKEDRVYIYSGDTGWDKPFGLQYIREYIIGKEECLWLDACLRTTKCGPFSKYAGILNV